MAVARDGVAHRLRARLIFHLLACGALTACAAPTPSATRPAIQAQITPPPTPPVTWPTAASRPAVPAHTATDSRPPGPGQTMPSAPPGLPVPLAPVLERVTLAWRAGHDIDTLRQALLAEGWLERASGLQAFDVTGDSRPEWLVTVAPPESVLSLPALPDGRQGVFWIVNDSGLAYAVGRSDALWLSAPEVVTVADFTGDDVYDVVVEATGCGAHTCFQHYQVISAQGGSLRDVVRQKDRPPGETHVIAISSSEPATADETGDGVYDFVIHGGAAGSAGAGIHRRFTEIWSWDGSMMVLAERRMDFSDYRHHLLYDANAAFDAGRLDVAQAAYVRVIEDVTLQDSPAFVPGDPTSYEDSRAFAAFRLCLVGL